jgi:hypothetical protein
MDALMNAAVDAIVMSDEKGRILRANRSAGLIFGHDADALIGQSVNLLMPDALAARHDGFMDHHMATGDRSILDRTRLVEGRRADGSAVPLRISVGRADTATGTVFVSILQDQTDRHAMEEAAERSQRMDAIGRMTGGIAHDFNNLLTVIIGNLELLDASGLTDRQRKLLSDALAAAELGADLTSRLTVFARKSDLRATRLDLNDQLDRALALLRPTMGGHCTVTARTQPGIWPVAADAAQFQTAILNLATNAHDAMPNGCDLVIETRNIDIDDDYVAQDLDVEPGRYVRLSVSDNGMGMDAETRARALEPFFTTKSAGHGTGLGLPMVYGFVKQSGGHLTIYSEPGQGTTVSLYFPALSGDATDARPDTPPKNATGRALPAAPGRALVVEDNARLRALTEERLAALGFACRTAATADAAWDILQDDRDFALVFTDMVMPGAMTGFDLAQRIAAERPGIAVLLTSGFSETMLQDDRIGTQYPVLRKPYSQNDLRDAVYAVLDRPG